MAKIHPGISSAASLIDSEERSRYTVWMRSLVFNGCGFTVYDSHGNLAYRIDNYDSKCSNSHVFLMDFKGHVLCNLLKKKLRVLEHWNCYKGETTKNEKLWFKVKKIRRVVCNKGSPFSCQVTIKDDGYEVSSCITTIQGCSEKSPEFQINTKDGILVAEVKRKEAGKGVMLGNDVLSLEVRPHVDESLIMALVVVHGLLSHNI